MKLKIKTAGLVGITMGLFIILLFLFIRPIILQDAKMMDQESLNIDVKRIHAYLNENGEDLQRLNRDWAVWDDTYRFMQDDYAAYVESNTTIETFRNNQIHFMLFIGTTEELVYSAGYRLDDGSSLRLEEFFPAPAELLGQLNEQGNSAIVDHDKLGPMMLTSEAILTSEGEGPAAGTLVMGKMLNGYFFTQMQKDLAVDFLPLFEGDGGFKALNAQEDMLTKRVYLGDGLALEVRQDQKYLEEKLSSLNNLFLSLSFGTLLFTLMVYYLLDLFVLSRISFLSTQLKGVDFEKPHSLNVRNSKVAKDEITDLEDSVQGMIGSLEKAHQNVTNLAYYDQLTGLPNRFHLYREFEKRTNAADAAFAVLFFDLDGFKRINDLHGHNCGDDLLKQVGARLTADTFANGSMLFRIGGDEFVLLAACKERPELVDEIEKMMSEIRREFVLDKVQVMISSSVGISFYPTDGKTLDDLLHYADSAMYEAKRTGKNNYIFYQETSNKQMYKYLLTLKNDLMKADLLEQLYLEYQPIMDTTGKYMKRIEALVRWRHPEHGMIAPLHFIPLAEEIGVIREIGEWVVRNAIIDTAEWNRMHGEELKVAVNVSKFQLKSKNELLAAIDETLAETGFSSELLQVEITESDTVAEHEEIALFIQDLKLRNIWVALDDFGVGTSSLFNLIKLKVDIVKIDRSFLQRVPDDVQDTVLLKGIYQILNDLGIEVVTEGIETERQLQFVTAENKSYLQGYYFSKPVSMNELVRIKESFLESLI